MSVINTDSILIAVFDFYKKNKYCKRFCGLNGTVERILTVQVTDFFIAIMFSFKVNEENT